jgi:penicillin-binding protein 1C
VRAGLAWLLLATCGLAHAQPSFDSVRAAHRPSDVPLLARDGSVLQLVRTDATTRRGPWVALHEVSPALRHALVLGEDRRFWEHAGVDWRALAAGAWASAWNQRTRGASTITMQLAALLDADLARPAGGRGVGDKLAQIDAARALEATWSKTQVLEAYLNRVPLRGELVGVAAASMQLFGKHASGLDALEAAVLAALVRAPNAGAATLERRACELLKLQGRGCEGLATRIEQALARRPGPMAGLAHEALAPHVARRLAAQAAPGATALHSTLDARLQRQAVAALRRQLAELRGRNVEDGAVLVLDNRSGQALAWVGSAGASASAAEVDAVLARRQPGSTIKPFVVALALQQRLITPASWLDDSPLQLSAGGALYQPRNYDERFRGPVRVREALASSLNVPAVRVGALLGPEALFDGLNRAGLKLTHSAGFHGHALALGSADVTLFDLAHAYRGLANAALNSKRLEPGSTAAFEPAAAWLVAHMLADPAARAATFGLDSALVTRGWAAVKTGTSKDMRDNWCIGFTPQHTVAVWVGNASGAPMHGVSGVSGAAPVWREVMAWLQAGTAASARAPAPPPGLIARAGEWFIAGTEPSADQATGGPAPLAAGAFPAFGITSPREGSIVALDPEIPPAVQRLVFEGEAGTWLVNGRVVGHGTRVSWLPRPGRHVIERRSGPGGAGRSDRVAIEVRAAPPPRRSGG